MKTAIWIKNRQLECPGDSNAVSLTKTNTWLGRAAWTWETRCYTRSWFFYVVPISTTPWAMDYGSWTSCTLLLSLKGSPVRCLFWCSSAARLLCRVARFVRRDAKIPTKITRSIYHDLTEYAVSYYIAQSDYLSLSLSRSIDFILVVSLI